MQTRRTIETLLRHAVACGSNSVWVAPSRLVARNVLKLMLITSCLLASSAQAQIRAYVTNVSSDMVSVIDTATNTAVATIPVGPTVGGLQKTVRC